MAEVLQTSRKHSGKGEIAISPPPSVFKRLVLQICKCHGLFRKRLDIVQMIDYAFDRQESCRRVKTGMNVY